MKQLVFLALCSLLASCNDTADDDAEQPSSEPTALYRVTFEATWSAATHPGNYPAGAHFSPLIGVSHTHDAGASLFQPSLPASPGIKNMAELGNNTALRTEINTLIAQGKAFRLLDGRTATASPGSLTDTIRLSQTHSALSVVTMIAPSPDWFAALTVHDLFTGRSWAATRRIPAVFYDAGTDSGPDYTSADQPTTPVGVVREVNSLAPPLGYFVLERIK
ncbi:spondin domain-containing protein [Hymenobacter cellulosivorans]|uniref:Spondin domain-containing protein n=1 Tax=Hymenobacter cellulosivorans TaxID=2932249 RepID=A0ABY4FCN7_9BACT|nr:spondin domain-containing protein [Hymenobacter cellulosivorans]UOQ53793.1 spondin domain-containing protein [Hymenobacter cellulosivorans]